ATTVTTVVASAPAGASTVASTAPGLAAYKRKPTGSDHGAPVTTPTSAAPTSSAPTSAAPTSAAPTPTASRPVATKPPAPKPTATRTPAPKPTVTRKPAAPVHHAAPAPAPRTPTSWSALNRAISGIPGYSSHASVTWVITSSFGHYGMTDWYHNTIYLSPSIPSSQLSSVAKHEYGHILEARAYGGNIAAMIAGISRVFGGGGRGGLNGTEYAADCIARVNGATWTNYTSCSNPTWRAAARTLIAGRPL
ncbi:MAG: hypothetical protein QOF57_2404, partial [Frankiaceae bacterium]|nr:hypothetical protein [Frankiaceae bacterium]